MPAAVNIKKNFSLKRLAFSLTVSYGAGAVAALLSINAKQVFDLLRLPFWAPPVWLFGPVWATLYGIMDISLCLVLKHGTVSPDTKNALFYFGSQLFLSVIWCLLFFTLGLRFAALVCAVLHAFYILITAFKFWQIDRAAGGLLIPCLAWIMFAAALNFSIIMLNN